jgi:hypothetical protein
MAGADRSWSFDLGRWASGDFIGGPEAIKENMPKRRNSKVFFAALGEKRTLLTSIRVALLVGSVLGLINYGDRIFLAHDMHGLDWVKLAVTYCVPFCVATYGAARYAARNEGAGRLGSGKVERSFGTKPSRRSRS